MASPNPRARSGADGRDCDDAEDHTAHEPCGHHERNRVAAHRLKRAEGRVEAAAEIYDETNDAARRADKAAEREQYADAEFHVSHTIDVDDARADLDGSSD
jgi:hypothetical protein